MTHDTGKAVRLTVLVLVSVFTLVAAPAAFAGDPFVGQWQVTMTFQAAPGSKIQQTSMVTMVASPHGDSLVGRLTVTDSQNRTVGGVWRHVGKKISITYEPPCDPSSPNPCATLVLLGRLKNAST
ncbi:MAG TPA: hypothetical protein VJX67_14595, partial [Blastocatellia bacterium]|nr:hypothetical protein [Blastocatellia bacterium]